MTQNPHPSPNSTQLHQLLNSLPLIGQKRDDAVAASINQAVQGMAMAIHTQAAARLLVASAAAADSADSPTDALLQLLAQDAMCAAKAYFTGLGIATFHDKPQPPQSQDPQTQDPQSQEH